MNGIPREPSIEMFGGARYGKGGGFKNLGGSAPKYGRRGGKIGGIFGKFVLSLSDSTILDDPTARGTNSGAKGFNP